MPPPVFLVLLLALPLFAAASPPHSTDDLQASYLQPPPESIEITRPLPFESLDPACTLPVLPFSFGNTTGLPPAVANYTPPTECEWSRVTLHLSASCNGSQISRIAAVWLSGVELLRTSTPQPGSDGILWNVQKDVSRYSSLLRDSNITLAVMLENALDGVNSGVYELNLTFMYYSFGVYASADLPLPLFPPRIEKLGDDKSQTVSLKDSFNLNEKSADLILPISASTSDKGFWFKIQRQSDAAKTRIQIPENTYKAVIEVYVSFHGNDELFYSNPPNSYIDTNHLPTKAGNGAYREIEVKIDGVSIASAIPFPVTFPGSINPLFWSRVVAIGAFNLPSYEIELTPYLSMLLDGRNHTFEIAVNDAISYWLVDANLHLWLDPGVEKVLAGPIRYKNPVSRVQRSQEFKRLEGRATVQGNRQGKYSGWVFYSAGNISTTVEYNFAVDNTIEYENSGRRKEVKQQVEMRTKVRSHLNDQRISNLEVESKYYLHSKTTTQPGSSMYADMEVTKMETRLEENQNNDQARNILENTQKCRGRLLLGSDQRVQSGNVKTYQKYQEKDKEGCYERETYTDGRAIVDDRLPSCSPTGVSSW